MASRRSGGGASPAPVPPPDAVPADLLAVGRIADAWGVRGWVKVAPYNAAHDSVLRHCARWWIDGREPRDVERTRLHGAVLVCKPSGSDDRDSALALKGREIHASRRDFPRGDEGEFYWVDLVGCRVVGRDGAALGTVTAVEDYGAHPILRLGDAAGGEVMVPFVQAWIVSVDVAGRTIVTDWRADY